MGVDMDEAIVIDINVFVCIMLRLSLMYDDVVNSQVGYS